MSLLPKTSSDFSSTEYWNSFFKTRGRKAFEWYGEYLELSEHLHKYVKIKDDVLMIGCGNSTLSADLYDAGFKNIINIDISHVVIKQMSQTNSAQRPDMQFLQMDALDMSFPDEKFNVVLDKGTLDALVSDNQRETLERADKYFSEIGRVLKTGGRYICVSLLQEHILEKIVGTFSNNNWMLRIVRCHDAEKGSGSNGTTLPVFVIVATKFKNLPHMILELCASGDKINRLKTPNEITDAVKAIQNVAIITNGLSKNSLSQKEEIYLNLYHPQSNTPRYTIHVLDHYSSQNSGKFAAFIVPQGRELDWMFSTVEGRQELIKSAKFNRLAVVSLHRGQEYENLDAVKNELAYYVKDLAPKGLSGQIPFLSLGSDVGKRNVIYKGSSKISGDFVIEEVEVDDGGVLRRLIFLNNQFVVQSEAKLKSVKGKNGMKIVTDPGYLACDHHIYMTVGVQLALQTQNGDSSHAVVIGLGGGGLCTFLHKCFPKLNITAVDIDSEILNVARKFFNLNCDDKLKVIIRDGLDYLHDANQKAEKFDVILFDVDSKDVSTGMSCPPKQFVDEKVLNDVKSCLKDNGLFLLNLVCRDEKLKQTVIKILTETFETVISYKLQQDVNEVFFCSKISMSEWRKEFKSASESVNLCVKKTKLQTDNIVDVNSFTRAIKSYS